jgi:hypothetical protein
MINKSSQSKRIVFCQNSVIWKLVFQPPLPTNSLMQIMRTKKIETVPAGASDVSLETKTPPSLPAPAIDVTCTHRVDARGRHGGGIVCDVGAVYRSFYWRPHGGVTVQTNCDTTRRRHSDTHAVWRRSQRRTADNN